MMTGVLAGGLLLGAGGFALAADEMEHMGWNHGHRLAFIQGMVSHGLDSVGAWRNRKPRCTTSSRPNSPISRRIPKEHAAMRKQALDLLAAPTIDRAAIEKMRADVVARFDAKSKLVVGGLLDIADQLTPAQRAQLTAEIAEMSPRGLMGGGWRDGRHGHDDDRRDGDRRDNRSDGDSDKD